MQLKTILNFVERHKGFVYESVRWAEGRHAALEVSIRPRQKTGQV